MVIEDLEHVLTSLKLVNWGSEVVSPLGALKMWGGTVPLNLKPQLRNPSNESIQILTSNSSWNGSKPCKCRENLARDTSLRGVCIPKFGKISVIQLLGSYTLCCTDGEIWHGGVELGAIFQPHRCNTSPLRSEKPQIALWVTYIPTEAGNKVTTSSPKDAPTNISTLNTLRWTLCSFVRGHECSA